MSGSIRNESLFVNNHMDTMAIDILKTELKAEIFDDSRELNDLQAKANIVIERINKNTARLNELEKPEPTEVQKMEEVA